MNACTQVTCTLLPPLSCVPCTPAADAQCYHGDENKDDEQYKGREESQAVVRLREERPSKDTVSRSCET